MSEEQKAIENLYRKLRNFDVICFEKCIKDPQGKLGTNEEQCLKSCSIKMLSALSYMSSLNRNTGAGKGTMMK